MRDAIICTVGTSLFQNIKGSEEDDLKRLLEHANIKGLSLELLKRPPNEQLCGAEINSINSIMGIGALSRPRKLYLLVSDTEEGIKTGELLKMYYRNSKNRWKFDDAECDVIEGLSSNSADLFRRKGLTNLVREIAKIVKREGSERVIINATGGYKAQISFAGVIGQALGMPVYYMFQDFKEVIELPPQPISLDLDFWLNHAELFIDLADPACDYMGPIPDDDRFLSLIDTEEIGGSIKRTLNAMGVLFHESHKRHFELNAKKYLPSASIGSHKKKIIYEDNNHGKHHGLKNFLEKLIKEEFVKGIRTFYYNKDLPEKPRFRVSTKNYPNEIEGCYTDGKATTKFAIVTAAESRVQAEAVVVYLSNKYGEEV